MIYCRSYIYALALCGAFEYGQAMLAYVVIRFGIVHIFELRSYEFFHDNKCHFWSLAIHHSVHIAFAVTNVPIYPHATTYAFQNWLSH